MTKPIFCLHVCKLKPQDWLKAATFWVQETRLRPAPFFSGTSLGTALGAFWTIHGAGEVLIIAILGCLVLCRYQVLSPQQSRRRSRLRLCFVGQEMETPVMEETAGLWLRTPGGKLLLHLQICSLGIESVPWQRRAPELAEPKPRSSTRGVKVSRQTKVDTAGGSKAKSST